MGGNRFAASATQDSVKTDSERNGIETEKLKQSWCPENPYVKPTAVRAAAIYRLALLALIMHINCSEQKSLNEILFPRPNNKRLKTISRE